MKLEKSFFIDAPLETVQAAMRDPGLIEASEKARDALSVEIQESKKTDTEHEYETIVKNYARGITGVDKNKTEINRLTNKWDLKSNEVRWSWKGDGQFADKAKITGHDRLAEKDNGTEITFSADVEISVPLLGKKISKMAAAEFEKEWPKYVDLLTKWIKK